MFSFCILSSIKYIHNCIVLYDSIYAFFMTTYISKNAFRKPLLGASKFGWLELGL